MGRLALVFMLSIYVLITLDCFEWYHSLYLALGSLIIIPGLAKNADRMV